MASGNAFVYGTLMADEVVARIIKRVPLSRPALLSGFVRFGVRDRVYPAIVPWDPEARIQGKVLIGLNSSELEALDVYEDVEYYRQSVKPVLEDGSTIDADVYVWKEEYMGDLEIAPWSYDTWRQENLHKWVSEMTEDGAHP